MMQPHQVHQGRKQVTSVHHSNPARPSVRQSWRSGHAALPRHSSRGSLRCLHPTGVRFRSHPIISLRLRGIERQQCRRRCAAGVSAASSAVGSPTTVQGVNLRALGKLTVKLGFWHAEDHQTLQQIVEETKRRQIYDEQYKCCNESRLKTVVESLGVDEMEVVRSMATSTQKCLPSLGIGELRQVALHFAATNATGLEALFSGIMLEAESRVRSQDGPASSEWKCQCVSDIVWSLHRGQVESERFTSMACSLALDAIPELDIFQLSNLAFRYARAGLSSSLVFDAVGRAAIQQLPRVQLMELPRVFLRFEFAAEHCREVSGGVPAGWWPDLQEQFCSVARSEGPAASLEMMESVADIIVQEGIALDHLWVAELRRAVAEEDDMQAYSVKRLAKALQTLQWADMCPPSLLLRAENAAVVKLQNAVTFRKGVSKGGGASADRQPSSPSLDADVDATDNLVVLADTALQFSNCGSANQELFSTIAEAAVSARRGLKQPGHIAKAAGKLAAAGVKSIALLEALEARIDQSKGRGKGKALSPEVEETLEQIRSLQLGLWSDAPLCAIWGLARTLPPPPTPPPLSPGCLLGFSDPSKPLAIDIGCGFGGYVLGMAGRESPGLLGDVNWLGIDTLPQSSRRANGVAERWGIQGRTRFVLAEARSALERIDTEYPGPLQVVCIQFPTPFQSATKEGTTDSKQQQEEEVGDGHGNGALPEFDSAIHGKGQYMVESNLVESVARALAPGSHLLLQSNVEEVATTMEAQFRHQGCFEPGSVAGGMLDALTLGRTETEAACRRSGREVHRVLLRKVA